MIKQLPPSPNSDAAKGKRDNVLPLPKTDKSAAEESSGQSANQDTSQSQSDTVTTIATKNERPSQTAAAKVNKIKYQKPTDFGKLSYLLEHFALIYGTDTVWDDSKRLIMRIAAMGHAYGSEYVKMWKNSDKRRTISIDDVVFDPSLQHDEQKVNLFDGIKVVPKEGDVQPYLNLVHYLLRDVADTDAGRNEAYHYLISWLAYPLQNPGFKLRTACLFHGDEGAGKNLMFDAILAIYGRYGALVGQDELEDKFNDWRSQKCFVIGDEVSSRAELVHNKNRLKGLITSSTVQINPKGLPRREEKNCMNIAFLSNELQPLALDNSDRRYFVVYTPARRETEFYDRVRIWLENNGVSHLYHYLLHYDTFDFDPYKAAPETNAKIALVELNRKSPERFFDEWHDGEIDLPFISCAIEQLYRGYSKYCGRSGDRYPATRAYFTRLILRYAKHQDHALDERVIRLTGAHNSFKRMFLTLPPPSDRAIGEWAATCFDSFEIKLKNYLGQNRFEGDSL